MDRKDTQKFLSTSLVSLSLLTAILITLLLLVKRPESSQASTLAQTGQWQATSTTNAPSGRYGHTAIWTDQEMLIWGGYFPVDNFLNDGRRYNPVNNSWTAISITNAPIGRLRHTAIWTGQEMIVWGGESGGGGATTNTGGRYSPITNTWTAISIVDAPSLREMHSAIWTGSEMIVWGGCSTVFCNQIFDDGGRYNPTTDTWTPITNTVGLVPRNFHQAIWTGDRMIIWGGTSDPQGVSYDPVTNIWTSISATNAPTSTFQGASVWTGSEFIVWGGCTTFSTDPCTTYLNSGGRYNPSTNTWTPITTNGAPAARWTHSAIWTGQEMVIWGGCGASCYNSGGSYNPQNNTWETLSTTNAPTPRSNHKAVWTGEAMVVWGGCDVGGCGGVTFFNSGGKYQIVTIDPPIDLLTYLPIVIKK